jgi:hypothetical protein
MHDLTVSISSESTSSSPGIFQRLLHLRLHGIYLLRITDVMEPGGDKQDPFLVTFDLHGGGLSFSAAFTTYKV